MWNIRVTLVFVCMWGRSLKHWKNVKWYVRIKVIFIFVCMLGRCLKHVYKLLLL